METIESHSEWQLVENEGVCCHRHDHPQSLVFLSSPPSRGMHGAE